MNSKTIIAVGVVAILLIAGVAAFLLLKDDSKGGDEPAEKTDIIDKSVQVGDSITIRVNTVGAGSGSNMMTESEYLALIYPDISGMEYITDTVCPYQGEEIMCHYYLDHSTDTFIAVSDTGVMYMKNVSDYVMNLSDTDLDLTKTVSEQNIEKSDWIEFEVMYSFGTVKVTYTAVSKSSGGWSVECDSDLNITETVKEEVISTGEGEGITVSVSNTEEITTKTEYLSAISYSNLIAYFNENGIDYEITGKSTQNLSTTYGLRSVTVCTIEYVLDGAELSTKVYYSGDIIYMTENECTYGGIDAIQINSLVSSTHITPANTDL